MQQLINIEKRVIGAEEVNSVNARDLWIKLEIGKDFSNWMKQQFDTLGLEENVDYLTLALKGERKKQGFVAGSNKIDYIITADTAKHISMASRTPQGKEVRDYFIAVEKAYKQELVAHTSNLSPALVETAVAQAMENILVPMLTEQAAQRNGLEIVIKMLHESKAKENALYEAKINSYKKTLSADQMDKINAAVALAARSVANLRKMPLPQAKMIVFRELNMAMDAKSYHHILSHKFNTALAHLRVMTDTADAKIHQRDKMFLDEQSNDHDEYYDEEAEEEY